jgi:uncharacterized membrane protein
MTDLGVPAGDTVSTAYSINAKDQVVGQSALCRMVRANDSCDSALYRGFLWENGSLVALQPLLVPGSNIFLNNAININDRGEIVGIGTLPSGSNHIVLLVPCDEDRE